MSDSLKLLERIEFWHNTAAAYNRDLHERTAYVLGEHFMKYPMNQLEQALYKWMDTEGFIPTTYEIEENLDKNFKDLSQMEIRTRNLLNKIYNILNTPKRPHSEKIVDGKKIITHQDEEDLKSDPETKLFFEALLGIRQWLNLKEELKEEKNRVDFKNRYLKEMVKTLIYKIVYLEKKEA